MNHTQFKNTQVFRPGLKAFEEIRSPECAFKNETKPINIISKTMSKGRGIEAVEPISEEEMERRLEVQDDEIAATGAKCKGQGIKTFTKTISEEEMDRRLEAQHDDVVEMLKAAHAQWERGEFAALEPLNVFLREANESFEAG